MAIINGTAIAELLNGTALADVLNGLGGNDTLIGGGGNDKLNGGSGADSMEGGAGNDIYYVNHLNDIVVEGAGAGVDTVYSYLASYTLGANLENLRIISAGAANATGNNLNNVIYAGAGDNIIDGLGGKDTVSYQYASGAVQVDLSLNQQFTGASGWDLLLNIENLTGSKYGDTLKGDGLANRINGGNGDDALVGANGNDTLLGGAGADTLNGGEGNDSLDGGVGIDSMAGWSGNDIYVVDDSSDVVTELWSYGYDEVRSTAASYSLGENVEKLVILANGGASGTGNAIDNVIVSGTGNDTLDGGGGYDWVSFENAGAAIIVNLASNAPQETGGAGTDQLTNFENILGSAFDDALTGNDGANEIDGGAGNDTMSGGAGQDVYYVRDAGDQIIEANNGGVDHVISYIADYTMDDYVEWGSIASDGAANMTGNGLNNVIDAGKGDNVIDGGNGYDTVSWINTTGGGVTASLLTGTASGHSGTDTLINVEALGGSSYDDWLEGDANANTLSGNQGADTLIGGAGDDTYLNVTEEDTVTELSNGGTDSIHFTSGGLHTMPANVENALLFVAGVQLVGNSLDNFITPNNGADTVDGGAGYDTVSYQFAPGAITLDLGQALAQQTGGSGLDTLINVESVIGSNYNDSLSGSSGANTLDGGYGDDTMTGGAGNDAYYVDSTSDVVVEAGGGGTDTIYSKVSLTLPAAVENLVLTNFAANINGTGNALNNVIEGNNFANVLNGLGGTDTVSYANASSAVTVSLATNAAQSTGGGGLDTLFNFENLNGSAYNDSLTGSSGANVIDGGLGSDTMSGGAGNDTYYVNQAGDIVSEGVGAGIDTVISAVSYTLPANVEYLRLTAARGTANGTGNSLDNVIYASGADNAINGMGGTDTVSYYYSSSGVVVNLDQTTNTGGSGTDTITNIENISGSLYNDQLNGNSLNNSLTGNSGNDRLQGMAGNDTLSGGFGDDVFRFSTALNGVTNVDTISDFGNGNDLIELENSVFTKLTSTGTLSSANFRVGAAALDSNDYIVYNDQTGALYYDADGSGGGAAVQFATLTAHPTLSYDDFLVT